MLQQRNKILIEIDTLLENFTEQYLLTLKNLQIIPLIEIDLMKATLQNLYQQLQHLDKLQSSSYSDEINITSPHKILLQEEIKTPVFQKDDAQLYPQAEINIVQDKSILFADLLNEKEEPNTSSIESKPTVQISETISKSNASNHVENTVIKKPIIHLEEEITNNSNDNIKVEVNKSNTISSANETKRTEVQRSVVTLFDDNSGTLGSKYKEQETLYAQISKSRIDETVADKLHRKPLADLKKSIGINERFSFVNELFAGNKQLYDESIEKINGFEKYEDAYRVLHQELFVQLNWKTSSVRFMELEDLIKRRFGV